MTHTYKPWLETSAELGIPAEIDADAFSSVVAMLEEAMTRHADRTAFVAMGQTLGYADVDRLSGDFAAWLQHRLGIVKGDRVAVMMPNLLAFPVAFLGIARTGAIQVNVNPLYTPRELRQQLDDSGAETIVVYSGATATLAEAIGGTQVKHVVTVMPGDGGGNAAIPGPAVDARLHGSTAFADALAEGARLERKPVALDGNDLLFLQYTGGTTGISKGAALSHRNLVANTMQFKAVLEDAVAPGQEVIVTAIPLYHIFALMVNFLTYFSAGATNWLVANPRDMDGFVATLKASKFSVIMGVNTLYAGLVAHPKIREVDFSRLKLAGGGGAAIIAAVSARWQDITGTFIREGYGLSETSPVLSFTPMSVKSFMGTTGLPLPSTDIRLLDDAGHDVAPGEAGEVCAAGPQVMKGYWRSQCDAGAFTADGYFRTGDIGVFDEHGFLKIVDRKKDMILVSGFNVYPNEVEAVATACQGVAECACVGRPDAKTGEAVTLFVVKAGAAGAEGSGPSGAEASLEERLLAHCRRELTPYKVPTAIRFVAALPKSTVGKILRRELRN